MPKKRLLIFDFNNNFIRNFVVNPTLGRNGQPIGGVVGFLKSLQKIIKETKPDEIVIAVDGPGGSTKRKLLHKDYKKGRKPIKLNRFADFDTEEEHLQNRLYQIKRLQDYLFFMPMHRIILDGVEADDIIAYLCNFEYYKNYAKVIVSSDFDFLQLINNNVFLYRPTQNELLSVSKCIDKFGIHPNNFALAKAIAGDKSDNIEGIEKVGLKTISNRLEFMKEENFYNIDYIVNYCKDKIKESKIKAYENIANNKVKIEENYNLVQLVIPKITLEGQEVMKEVLKKELFFSEINVIRMMGKDGIEDYMFKDLFEYFGNMLDKRIKSKKK